MRQRSPWLFFDIVYNLTPSGREHNRCLKILHGFTNKVHVATANSPVCRFMASKVVVGSISAALSCEPKVVGPLHLKYIHQLESKLHSNAEKSHLKKCLIDRISISASII